MKIYYFTSTGNCLYVAKKIKEKIENCELTSMAKALKNKDFNIEEEVVGLIYPIHCGSLPMVVEEFIENINVNRNSYIFAIGVTGSGEAKDSFPHINGILKNNEISNYLTVKYISNYTRAGRNPTKERALKAIESQEQVIEDFIKSLKLREIKKVDYKLGKQLMYKGWKTYFKNKDKAFNVNEDCIGCEMCKKICPVDDIEMINNKPSWLGKCTDCMACINICPKKAINIGKRTIKKNRYINPHIKAYELIE